MLKKILLSTSIIFCTSTYAQQVYHTTCPPTSSIICTLNKVSFMYDCYAGDNSGLVWISESPTISNKIIKFNEVDTYDMGGDEPRSFCRYTTSNNRILTMQPLQQKERNFLCYDRSGPWKTKQLEYYSYEYCTASTNECALRCDD